MSHVVSIETQVRDPVAISSACRRLKLAPPVRGEHRLFSETETGLGVWLPQWRYPVVCQTDSGEVKFDNYENRWGDREHLDRFLQAYAVEKAKLEGRKQGHSVAEQLLADGSIQVTVSVGGGS